MQIGVYPNVTLKDVRLKAFEAKRLIDNGVDPMAQRKAEKREALGVNENTFEVIANAWFAIISPEWSGTHKDRTQNLFKIIYSLGLANPITEITPPEL